MSLVVYRLKSEEFWVVYPDHARVSRVSFVVVVYIFYLVQLDALNLTCSEEISRGFSSSLKYSYIQYLQLLPRAETKHCCCLMQCLRNSQQPST